MALPSTWKQPGDTTPSYAGIGINLIPGDVLYGCEVQRTSDDGTGVAASTGATSIAEYAAGVLPESGRVVFDALPMDDAKRFYRARHTGIGYDAGAWTSWTTGHKPVLLGQRRPDILPGPSVYPLKRDRAMTDTYYPAKAANAQGSQFATDMYLPSTMVLTVGTTGTPASITKSLTLPATLFGPELGSDTTYFRLVALRHTGGGSSDHYFVAMSLLPPGVTATAFEARMYRASTNDIASVSMNRVDESLASLTALGTATHDGSSWQNKSVSISEAVSTAPYLFEARLQWSSTGTNVDAQLMRVTVTYTMPSYEKGY